MAPSSVEKMVCVQRIYSLLHTIDGHSLASVVEHLTDLGVETRQDHGVKQGVQAAKNDGTDDNGDDDLHAGIDEALGAGIVYGGGCGGLGVDGDGVELGLDLVDDLLHFEFPHIFLCFFDFGLFLKYSVMNRISRTWFEFVLPNREAERH